MDYIENNSENKEHKDNCAVHEAVLKNSLQTLKALVEEDKHSLSCTNSLGQTPLLTSIVRNRSRAVILYLIEAGSDVNAVDCWNRNSLHLAIEHRLSHEIIHELLEKGVDVNVQDVNGRTPMHHAVLHGTELLSMLLYYNADVTIESDEGFTALTNAIGWNNFEAVEVLVNYYCHEDLSRIINIYFATDNHWFGLQSILKLDSSEIFKAIWTVIDPAYLLNTLPSFIVIYLNQCSFPKREWVESLLLILESDGVSALIDYMNTDMKSYTFKTLFCAFYDKKIDTEDRVTLITLFLSLGADVHKNNVQDVLNIFGCGDEFECLIYGIGSEHLNMRRVLDLFEEQIKTALSVGSRVLQGSIIMNLGYFSFPSHVREMLLKECEKAFMNRNKIQQKLVCIPEFPTLLELSRNQVRNYIVMRYKIKYSYGVLDVVKRLEIPKVIKDIILFRNIENNEHNDICAIHQAVLINNLQTLKALVEEDKLSLSCTNSLGQTPLLTSIIESRSDAVILYLIEAGSDVNSVDCYNRNSLYLAIEHRLPHEIIHELLEKGVDVNVQDLNGCTPMQHAVLYGTELLSMLLYYNADVTIESLQGFTALKNAIRWYNFEAVEMLVSYHCQEDLSRIINNHLTSKSHWLGLQFILKLESAEIFKAIWAVVDSTHLSNTSPSFIIGYLNQCNFLKHEWVELLLLILESDGAPALIEYMNKNVKGYTFKPLFWAFYTKKVDRKDRITIINLFLSLGLEVDENDFQNVLNIFGCGEEFECLIYGISSWQFEIINHPLCYYLVNLENDYSVRRVLHLFKEQIKSVLGSHVLQESIIRNLGYFSIPSHIRGILLEECEKMSLNVYEIHKKLQHVPEFPTLLELSRNQVRNYIVMRYKIKHSYHVLDVVKRLEIPKVVKDIILFRNLLMDLENLKRRLKRIKQAHVLNNLNDLDEKNQFVGDIVSCIEELSEFATNDSEQRAKLQPFPLKQAERENDCSIDQLTYYRNVGFEEISNGRVAALVLAGGQGTRLGVTQPKGTFSIGLPSEKSLFQIQAERIQKIETLANEFCKANGSIAWYVMTSDVTNQETETFFKTNNYFGIDNKNVLFFNQGTLPVLDAKKRLVVDKGRLVSAPDGNGGLYKALADGLILKDMEMRGVKHIYVYSVDNVLVKVADPIFIGYCIRKQADCGAKVVTKTNPLEKIGVLCTIKGETCVAEYSEIQNADANLRDDRGNLIFNLGNICNHYFSFEFLEKVISDHATLLKAHLVPTISGFKLEKFIFDVFRVSKNFIVWEVERYKEFSALKNSEAAETDSARTARYDLFYLHKKYIEAAGGTVIGDVVEISPLVSYAGENLETKVKNLVLKAPVLLN
ncbi:hypothetical protein FQR65_LT06944 [Abscondita terminalis]|nr:hypothetical protein FQR65_LT06944 [Abscondita terminalis]